MFLVEAVGPLLVLSTYADFLRVAAVVLYIAHVAAQHALLRGSSIIYNGDHVVGPTRDHAADLDCWPYFSRIHTNSNPID